MKTLAVVRVFYFIAISALKTFKFESTYLCYNDLNNHSFNALSILLKTTTMKQKNLITIVIAAIISFAGFAQSVPVNGDGKIEYQEVVDETGTPAEFFIRAVSWINSYYTNPFDVTKTRDESSGIIKGLHRFRVEKTLEDGQKVDAGTVQYEFKLEFKDDRYRYTLSDFVLRQNSAIPVEKWLNASDSESKSYLKQLDNFAQEWINSLKEGMKPVEVKKEEDW